MPLAITRGYHQHNVLLSIAVNNGLIGLTMFSVLFVHWSRSGWRLSKNRLVSATKRGTGLVAAASLAGYMVGGMFQDVTKMPMINRYLFFLAGLIVNLVQEVAEEGLPKVVPVGASPRLAISLASTCDRETAAADGPLRPSAS